MFTIFTSIYFHVNGYILIIHMNVSSLLCEHLNYFATGAYDNKDASSGKNW